MGTLYQSFLTYYSPQFFLRTPADPEQFKKVESAFEFLNTFLKDQEYVAGDEYTIADIAILGTVSTFAVMDFKLNNYPNVERWLMDMKEWIASKMK